MGVMAGTTMVAPNLQDAQTPPLPTPAGAGASTTVSEKPDAERLALPASEISQSVPKIEPVRRSLRIVSAFPAKTPILGELPQRLKQQLPRTTGGRLGVTVYDPGTLINVEDSLNAVKSGTIDGAFSAPGHWAPDDSALQLFTSVPFGPDALEYLSWFYFGGGESLFQEIMKSKGVHAMLCGAIPPEASGWYRNPVRTIDDFRGLNIRAFGLGGDVLRKVGAQVRTLDAGGILAQFELGNLDGAEYSLPSIDAKMGFQKFARNYYFPGWHQPVTMFALAINPKTWTDLSSADQKTIETICGDNVRYALTRADAEQFEVLKDFGLSGIQVRRWPADILDSLKESWKEVVREKSVEDENFAKVWEELQKFRRDYAIWHEISRL